MRLQNLAISLLIDVGKLIFNFKAIEIKQEGVSITVQIKSLGTLKETCRKGSRKKYVWKNVWKNMSKYEVASEEAQYISGTSLVSLEVSSASLKKSPMMKVPNWKIAGIIIAIILVSLVSIVTGVVLTKQANERSSSGEDGSLKSKSACNSFSKPAVILISADGFRADYFDRNLSPNIKELADNGVRAKYMKSQYPTMTFPNHYTIVTGLYPESHGIVSNSFKNENRTDSFRIGGKTANDAKWWHGEPIWVTAKKQGLKTATYFWVGSETDVQGIRPDYWERYNGKIPFEKRVDQVLSWLEMDASKRPTFLSLYFEEPDKQGHKYGTQSTQTNNAIKRVDKMIGRLIEGIRKRNLTSCTNIVLVSDHGMADISCSRVIYLDQMMNLTNISVVGQGATSLLYLKKTANLTKVMEQLKCKHKNLRAYSKLGANIPKRIHYSNSKRIGDVVLISDVGWSILKSKNRPCSPYYKGSHGYDNFNADMRGLFIANGPSFKKGLVASPFSNIEVYNMLTEILGLKPAPNNGTVGSLAFMLQKPNSQASKRRNENSKNFDRNCKLPSNIKETIMNCSHCSICSDCDSQMQKTISQYRAHINLSISEVERNLKNHFPWGVPSGGAGEQGCLLTQKHYVIGYSGFLHVPLWVGYKLTSRQMRCKTPSQSCFRRDLRLKLNQSSFCADYNSTEYQRAQLAPSADFNFDKLAIQDTFILSNVVPQSKHFNQQPGLWYKAEGLVRKWAITYDPVYVISGSIFDVDNDGFRDEDNLTKRWMDNRKDGVAIPTHFYKIVVRCNKVNNNNTKALFPGCHGNPEALSFVLPHNKSPECKIYDWRIRLQEYIASINDIEKLTGHSFFSNLPYPFVAAFKANLASNLWLESTW